jgi:hypothetical protein
LREAGVPAAAKILAGTPVRSVGQRKLDWPDGLRAGSAQYMVLAGAHLVVLIQHSDEVFNAVLSMAKRHDLLFAQKLDDLEQRMLELTSMAKELRSRDRRS